MNYFTKEQSNRLISHIKYMMETDKLDFCIYFIKSDDIDIKSIAHINSYYFDSNHVFEKYLIFHSYSQIDTFIKTYFKSYTDFCNEFFVFKSMENNIENNPFIKSIDYIEKTFPICRADKLKNYLTEILSKKHIFFFNFIFNKETDDNAYAICEQMYPNRIGFFQDNLTNIEKDYFQNQYLFNSVYKYIRCENNQIEFQLTESLICYRIGINNFNSIIEMCNNYETFFQNYFIPKCNEYDLIKHGENNKYTTALISMLNKLKINLTNKKIQFIKQEPIIHYISNKLNSLDRTEYNKMFYNLQKIFPEKTEKMFDAFFKCEITLYFDNAISMHVKKSFKKTLQNYFIDNNIKPCDFKYLDGGYVTNTAEGFVLSFITNDYESIGINPIKFMIPKLKKTA